jgi:hypothetical protein
MQFDLSLIARTRPIFTTDIQDNAMRLAEMVASSSFLIIGAAGSIGQSVSK